MAVGWETGGSKAELEKRGKATKVNSTVKNGIKE